MCNLYETTKTGEEVARLFGVVANPLGNAGDTVYPCFPGVVVAQGRVRQMTWGFSLTLKGKIGQPLKPKPINNARADKLDGFIWRYSFQERRCLFPVTAFADAEGEKGAKIRPGSRRMRPCLLSPAYGATAPHGGFVTRW